MGSTLVINATGVETRVALVDNGTISEFYLERKKDKGIVGNIYKGRVVRVLPGMQAAFVDVGLEKAAFLYVSDVFYDPDFSEQQFDLTEGEHEDIEDAYPEEHAHEESAADAAGEAAGDEEGDDEGEDEKPEGSVEAAAVPAEVKSEQPSQPEVKAEQKPEPEPVAAAAQPQAEAPAEPAKVEAEPVKAEPVKVEAAETKATETKAEPTAPEAAPAPASTPADAPAGEAVKAEGTTEAPAAAATAEAAPAQPNGQANGAQGAKDERGESRGRDRGRRRRRGGMARREARERGGEEEREQAPHGQRERNGERNERNDRNERSDRNGHEERNGGQKPQKKMANIQDLLKVGQEIIVQVAKDPIGTKGARVTSHISLPGRHLVFMPTVDHVGISRRIDRESERRRLREIVDRLRPQGTGFIVRTVAENISTEKLEADAKFLISIWNTVGAKKEKMGAPALLHPDLDLALRATRDLFAQDVDKLVIDDRVEWDRIRGFLELQDPALKERVVLHDNDEPIFDAYGIEHEIQKASQRKVWLKSGGYLIMDQAEALTAIDVNSGRYVGKKSLEETITKINIEAAKEIVYQLRLRNIGGIIIIDFIDMDKAQNREKVFKALQDALGRDKAKTNVLKISELGLVEMTRKRVRESLGRTLNEPCSYCDGRGHLKSKSTIAYEIFREIRREATNYKEATLVVNCHPDVARVLQADERDELRYLMDRFNKSIHVRPQPNYHQEQFDIYGKADRPQRGGGKDREDGEGGEGREQQREAKPERHDREGREGGGREGKEGKEPREGGREGRRDRDRRDRSRNQQNQQAQQAQNQQAQNQQPAAAPAPAVEAPVAEPAKPEEAKGA